MGFELRCYGRGKSDSNPSIKLCSPPQQVEQMEKRAAEEKEKEIMERKV